MKRFRFSPQPLLIWALGMTIASAAAVDVLPLVIFLTPVAFALCFLWPARCAAGWKLTKTRVALALSLVLLISVGWTQWPLRLHFLMARPTIEALASRVEQGMRVDTPTWAGLFKIEKAEANRFGVVCLWIAVSPDRDGFVRTPADKVDEQFNVWWTVNLDGEWQFVWED